MSRYPMYYLLDEQGNPYPTADSHLANILLGEAEKRRVAVTERTVGGHEIKVSTVFLTIDHNFRITPEQQEAPPILFETMIFVDDHGIYTRRYETRESAQVGHDEVVARLDERLVQNIDIEQIAESLAE